MANLPADLLDQLRAGDPAPWNLYRRSHPTFRPDLSELDLRGSKFDGYDLHAATASRTSFRDSSFVGANCESLEAVRCDFQEAKLTGANFRNANLEGSDFRYCHFSEAVFHGAKLDKARLNWAALDGVNFHRASLTEADLRRASLKGADLRRADLTDVIAHRAEMQDVDFRDAKMEKAELRNSQMNNARFDGAYLKGADLRGANLSGAELTNADLRYAILVRANLQNAQLVDCKIYGASTWGIDTSGATQVGLNISHVQSPPVRVDSIDAAQMLQMFLDNRSLKSLIEVASSKIVLVLGRFSPKRKELLDAIREELNKLGFVGVVCDFHKPSSRDLTETISTLAHLSSFIIADLSDPRSVPHELMKIVPTLPSVPVAPIIDAGLSPYALFDTLTRYPWVLPIYKYKSTEAAVAELEQQVIGPAIRKRQEQSSSMVGE